MLIGIKAAILLLALGLGYIVCYLADREEKDLKTLGFSIGIFMILSSGLMLLRIIVWFAKLSGGSCLFK